MKKNLYLFSITIFFLIILAFSIFNSKLTTRKKETENTPATIPSSTSQPNFEVTIPSKALLKNYVTVSVKAETGTSCNLIFIPASGETLDMNTIAGKNGECVWRWKLEESYKKGTARLIFTINQISETHFLQILESF